MDIEFDDAKDRANLQKHDVSLDVGATVIQNMTFGYVDDRKDYGEVRMVAFGRVSDRLFVCVFTKRGEVYRIISVRRASEEEQREWL